MIVCSYFCNGNNEERLVNVRKAMSLSLVMDIRKRIRTTNLTKPEVEIKILAQKYFILVANKFEIELPFIAPVIITKEDTSPTYLPTHLPACTHSGEGCLCRTTCRMINVCSR